MVISGFDINKVSLGDQKYLLSPKTDEIKDKIDVVFCIDDNYAEQLAVTMASILLNLAPTTFVNFHIISSDFSYQNKYKLEKLKNIRNYDIFYYEISNEQLSMFPLNRSYISIASYYRLLLCRLLPKNLHKVLYLDCDIIVEEDLTKLFKMDIGNSYVAVVEDEASSVNIQNILLKFQSFYFNSGVILFNLDMLQNLNFFEICIKYFKENQERIFLQDQDILNGVLDGFCYKLPLRWNVATPYYLNDKWELTCSRDERWEAIYNPAIVHYTYIPKPWQDNCEHPLKGEYFKYLAYTPYTPQRMSFMSALQNFYS